MAVVQSKLFNIRVFVNSCEYLFFKGADWLTFKIIFSTNQDGHSFWTSNSILDSGCDGIVQPGGSANLRTRVIEFTGKFERVDRQCRAPLPSGRLCPREDRFKVNSL